MRHQLCLSLAVGLSARSAAAAIMTVMLGACASEVMTTRPPDIDTAGGAGTSAAGAAGMAGVSGAGGAGSAAAHGGTSGAPGAGTSGAPSAGAAGSGGQMQGGSGGTAGGAGGGGTAGGGGGGTAGGAPVAELISVGKASATDSEETANSNTVDKGNDGLDSTRWCAENSALDHWWSVDLGQSYTLTQVQILWEKAVAYQYLIEGSDDGSAWSSLVDNTDSGNTSQLQTLQIADEEARHLRITVTGLPADSWASFFEFRVYGY